MTHNVIAVSWIRYPNFFDLYRVHKNENKMLYVMGEERQCYIGSIGSLKEGTKGLGQRYQLPYVKRACSIFGLDEPAGQIAYAGIFVDRDQATCTVIKAAEAFVQAARIDRLGRSGVAYSPISRRDRFSVASLGEAPRFLIAA